MNYTNLHGHTDMTNALLGFPDSVNKINEYIQTAYDLGLNGISITEHEGISSHVQAIKYYKEMNKDREFKLIFGNEIYLVDEQEDLDNRNPEIETRVPYYHFLLNALDEVGHKQIRELSARAWQRAYMNRGLMRKPTYYSDIEDIIKSNQGHIVSSSACLGSYLSKMILDWKLQNNDNIKIKIHTFITWCIDVFGKENFFFEMQPCKVDNVEQRTVNDTLLFLSNVYDIKVICTTDSHYLIKDKAFIHKTLLNSKEGDREVEAFYSTTYLMGEQELRDYFINCDYDNEIINKMFQNTNDICNRVQFYDFEHAPMIPQLPLDKIPSFQIQHRYKQYYEKYKEFNYYANIGNIYDSYFFYRIEKALYELVELKEKEISIYIERLDKEMHELRLVSEAFNDHMAGYYTSMSKIIDLIWDSDSFSMPARGSSAGFLVCYLLEITQIDPVPLGDYFPYWRHMSAERGLEIGDIDDDSQSSKKNIIIDSIKKYWHEDRVLNVATFSKLTSKTAIEKSCKGLGISDDVAGYLKSMIPIERGSIWSLNDCLFGDKEKGRKPVTAFVNEINKYEYLKESALGIEGLIINRGIHASGLLIGNEPYVNTISCMRSPKGVLCSCYDLHDAEYCGQTKVDMLTVAASDKIRKTMDLLIEHGYIEWQGSLKKTYWKYLHPDVLNYDNLEMWKMIKQIYSIFQFDTPVSVRALSQTNPTNVMDLSATNSLLRLMEQNGQENPLEKYTRYKENIQNWVQDCLDFGLNEQEMNIIKKYCSDSYMLADSQEKVMLISMDKNVSGFSLKDANKIRKAIAKKSSQVLEETKKMFFEACTKQGTRDVFADYVWNVMFAMSFGYSFSQLHSYSYSIIALQELNLNYFYPSIYWNTACLTVESSSEEAGYNEEQESKGGATNYGRIAKSIYKMKKFGVNILPPDINLSNISFTPIEKDNTIRFGLGGISGINQDIATDIISGRPYNSFEEFYNYHKNTQFPATNTNGESIQRKSMVTTSKFVKLIQAGCFDSLNIDRITAMKWLVYYENPPKQSLTMANINNAIKLGISLPKDLIKALQFKQYVLSKEFFYQQDPKYKSKKHYLVEPRFALRHLEKYYLADMKEDIDYYYEGNNLFVIDKSLEKVMAKDLSQLQTLLNEPEIIKDYNQRMLQNAYISLVKTEDINKWSFDSLAYYGNYGHELENINYEEYNLSNYANLPEYPIFELKSYGKREWRQYELSRICGVVLDKNDTKSMVDILTPENDVVVVKFNSGQYSYYNQTISEINEDGKKEILDGSFFKRGSLLMITGYRKGEDGFNAKNYKRSGYVHTVIKINKVYSNGELDLQTCRYNDEEND